MSVWVTADLHFGDNSLIENHKRKFKDTEEMDRVMINKWNDRVKKDDIVYVLGNFSMYEAEETISIMKQLKGKKRLVLGVQDRYKPISFWQEVGFEMVYDHPICIGRYILSHKPIPISIDCNFANVHGYLLPHTYNEIVGDNYNHFNARVEQCDYFPENFEELRLYI